MNEPSTAVFNSVAVSTGARPLLKTALVSALLAGLIWFVFGQTLSHQFVAWDDQNYIYQNPRITAGLTADGLAKAFTDPHARNWHPLTTISHMLDCQLFGLDPAGHHLVNVLLHTAAALLLFSVLRNMTGAFWRSAFVTAVFAIHPLRAESVAWIAERKDVLSGVFFMLTLVAYVHYARRTSIRRYLIMAAIFSCGLMSKATLVTTPVLLLLLDYWPLKRWPTGKFELRWLTASPFIEKLPLLFLSTGSSLVTVAVQKVTVDYSNHLPLATRIVNALLSHLIYLRQFFWPTKLSVLYSYSADQTPLIEVAATLSVIIAITALALVLCKRAPYLFVGWGWYLVSLVPAIGLIQVGMQPHADRYTYLPEIGLAISVTWAATDLLTRVRYRRQALAGFAALVLELLGWRASIQTSYWKNTSALWTHALAVAPDNDVANYNVAEQLRSENRINEAITHYQKALTASTPNRNNYTELNPAIIHNALGNALADAGRLDEALSQYRQAVDSDPDFADAHSNIADLLARRGDIKVAIEESEKALAIPPEDAVSHIRLGTLFDRTGRHDLAIGHYRRALQIAPDSVVARKLLARDSRVATSP